MSGQNLIGCLVLGMVKIVEVCRIAERVTGIVRYFCVLRVSNFGNFIGNYPTFNVFKAGFTHRT